LPTLRVSHRCQQPRQLFPDPRRAAIDHIGQIDFHFEEQLIVLVNTLPQPHSDFFEFDDFRGDVEHIPQHRTAVKRRLEIPHDQAGLIIQRRQIMREEDLAPCPLAVFDVVGMIDDPTGVGVFIIDSDLHGCPLRFSGVIIQEVGFGSVKDW